MSRKVQQQQPLPRFLPVPVSNSVRYPAGILPYDRVPITGCGIACTSMVGRNLHECPSLDTGEQSATILLNDLGILNGTNDKVGNTGASDRRGSFPSTVIRRISASPCA